MLQRENLASRELSAALYGVIQDVTEIANFVNVCASKSRLFQELCCHLKLRTNSYYFISKVGGGLAAKF